MEIDPPKMTASDYGLPDDEIVSEIPLYLAHGLSKDLHLLQYPQLNGKVESGRLLPSIARIKPKHGQIELDLPVTVNDIHYNKERGRELGIGLTDDNNSSNRLLDIQTLISVNIPKKSNYLVGVVSEGGIHLTPIEKVTQLRSNLKYLDRVNEKLKANSKLNNDDDEEEYADEATGSKNPSGKKKTKKETSKMQSVQVTVRSAQAEEALRQQQNSIAYIQQRLEEEPWSKLVYHDVGSDESTAISQRLVANNKGDLACKSSPEDYITAIIGSTEPDVN